MPIIDPDREPGTDLTPYQRAESWLYMMWMDVYRKCMTMIEQKLIDAGGSLGGGGGKHSIAVGFVSDDPMTISTVLPPGPVNPFGASVSIKKLYLYANDTVEVTFGLIGAKTATDTALNVAWGDEVQLTWEITAAGEALTSLGWTIEAEE